MPFNIVGDKDAPELNVFPILGFVNFNTNIKIQKIFQNPKSYSISLIFRKRITTC